MSSWRVPLSDLRVTEADIAAVVAVYRSGWLSLGPRTTEFEEALADFVNTPHALAASSGTAALHLICAALELAPGDEVIVPSMTFVATVNAVAYTGASPVFADIAGGLEPWLSVAEVEAAITERTRAVITMSYGGNVGQTAALAELCHRRDITLIEDAAHGLGSRLDGRAVGTFGHAGAFSFFSNKNLAVGEGGAAVTNDDELAARMRLLRSHGMTTLSWDRAMGHASSYDVLALGFNYRIDEPRAALAISRLSRLEDENESRRSLVGRYRKRLGELEVAYVGQPQPGVTSAEHLFAIVLDDGVNRGKVRDELAERGVQTSLHYPPVHRFSIYDSGLELTHTERYAARTVTLPLFAHMTEHQQDLVIDALASALSR